MELRAWSIRGERRGVKRAEFWLRFAPARGRRNWDILVLFGTFDGRGFGEGRALAVSAWVVSGLNFRSIEAPGSCGWILSDWGRKCEENRPKMVVGQWR